MRNLMIAITLLALTAPIIAQEKSDIEAKETVQKLLVPYREAFVKKDAAALSQMFAINGILVSIAGKEIHGRAQVEQAFIGLFKQMGDITTYEETVDHAEVIGHGVWAIGHAVIKGSSGSLLNNHWTKVYVPEGSDLKIRLLNIGVNVTQSASHVKP
jgi:ketosteroid isomerase-like protein